MQFCDVLQLAYSLEVIPDLRSIIGKKTKSTPMGSLDHPFNPLSLALGSGATFVARTLDRESKHLGEIVRKCNAHKGTSFVDIYQNCNIFNDGAFSDLTNRETKADTLVVLEDGQPMIYGSDKTKGLRLNGTYLESIDITGDYSIDDVLVHDQSNKSLAFYLSEITLDPKLPTPIGVLYKEDKPTYDDMMISQIEQAIEEKGKGDINKLLNMGQTWEVSE